MATGTCVVCGEPADTEGTADALVYDFHAWFGDAPGDDLRHYMMHKRCVPHLKA